MGSQGDIGMKINITIDLENYEVEYMVIEGLVNRKILIDRLMEEIGMESLVKLKFRLLQMNGEMRVML